MIHTRGFPNPNGLTCYINSVLIILSSLKNFRLISNMVYWLRIIYTNDIHNANEYENLIENIKKYIKIDTSNFNDVHEFYVLLIDSLHEKYKTGSNKNNVIKQNSRSNTYASQSNVELINIRIMYKDYADANASIVFNVFHTVDLVSSSCDVCARNELHFENTNCYHIAIDESTDLYKAIEKYYISFDTSIACDTCCKRITSHKMKRTIWFCPKILSVRIVRETFENNHVRVRRDPVDIPLHLNLRAFCKQSRLWSAYRLVGVIEHFGDAYNGHYATSLLGPEGFTLFDDGSPCIKRDPDPKYVVMMFYELLDIN